MRPRTILVGVITIFTFLVAYAPVPVEARLAGQSRPAPGGGQQGRPSPGGGNNRPSPGGGSSRPSPGRPNPGSPKPVRPSPGNGQRPGRPSVRPTPGEGSNRPPSGRPPMRPNPGRPGYRPQPGRPGGRPPQWGRPPAHRPSYHFRPNDRSYLHRYYRRSLLGINLARRPRFIVGGFFPYGDIQYITPLPPEVYGYLPPPPLGYQMGYFDGYVVVYDPISYFIANVVDLLQ